MRLTANDKAELLQLLERITSDDPRVIEQADHWRLKLSSRRGRPKKEEGLERGRRAYMVAESRKYSQEEIFSVFAEIYSLSEETIRKDFQAYRKLHKEAQKNAGQLIGYLKAFNQRLADLVHADGQTPGKK